MFLLHIPTNQIYVNHHPTSFKIGSFEILKDICFCNLLVCSGKVECVKTGLDEEGCDLCPFSGIKCPGNSAKCVPEVKVSFQSN